MLPSLRPLIAESMRNMAQAEINHSQLGWQPYMETKLMRLECSAETLEWCDARDPDNDRVEDLLAEREALLVEIANLEARLEDEIDG